MAHRRTRTKPLHLGHLQHLLKCMGRDDDSRRETCPCPPSCKAICHELKLTAQNSPRVDDLHKGRSYTKVHNRIARSWGLGSKEPSAAVKLTYIGLLTYTLPDFRWILYHPERLATDLGLTPRTFTDHLRQLEGLDLIRRVPIRQLTTLDRSNRHVICLLDLPAWHPGHHTDEDDDMEESIDLLEEWFEEWEKEGDT